MLLLTLVIGVSMIITYFIAKSRNADTVFWVVVAFVVGPFAIPFVFFSKPRKSKT